MEISPPRLPRPLRERHGYVYVKLGETLHRHQSVIMWSVVVEWNIYEFVVFIKTQPILKWDRNRNSLKSNPVQPDLARVRLLLKIDVSIIEVFIICFSTNVV